MFTSFTMRQNGVSGEPERETMSTSYAQYAKELTALMNSIAAVRDALPEGDAGARDHFTIQQLLTLFAVAKKPGITTRGLMEEVGISRSSVSRNTLALGEWHRLGKPGLCLVDAVADPTDSRVSMFYLNHKGQKVISTVLKAFTGSKQAAYKAPTAQEGVQAARASVTAQKLRK